MNYGKCLDCEYEKESICTLSENSRKCSQYKRSWIKTIVPYLFICAIIAFVLLWTVGLVKLMMGN